MKFRIDQQSYIDDKLIEAGSELEVTPLYIDKKTKKPVFHVPGPHWLPLDDDAKDYCEAMKHEYTGEVPDVLQGLEAVLNDLNGKLDETKLAGAITTGMEPFLTAMQTNFAAMQKAITTLAELAAAQAGVAKA